MQPQQAEDEINRRIKARKERKMRKSTQGVTLEQVDMAKQFSSGSVGVGMMEDGVMKQNTSSSAGVTVNGLSMKNGTDNSSKLRSFWFEKRIIMQISVDFIRFQFFDTAVS